MHPAGPPPAVVAPVVAGPAIAAPRPWNTVAWRAAHDAFVARARQGHLDVLYLGDSIVQFYPERAGEVFIRQNRGLGNVGAFGISGDRTQFVLWRVRNGELDGSGAKAVVLMVGTNNLASATPAAVAGGIAAIVAGVRTRLPNATVIVTALWPRGDADDPLREKAADVNERLRALTADVHVKLLDIGARFVGESGRLDPTLIADGLHPTAHGYEVWGDALRPLLVEAVSK